ncbi:MAG: cell division protein ZapA [Bacillota bacterium]
MKNQEKDATLSRATVSIFGQEYVVKGTEPMDYLEKISAYVDKKMRQISRKAPNLAPTKVAVLAALNIADEYKKLQDDYDAMIKLIEEEKQPRFS